MNMKGWILRRGIFAVAVLAAGMLILWRNAPSAPPEEDTGACARSLERFYREVVDYAEANGGKLPGSLTCPGFVYLGPEFDWKQVSPLVVEEIGRHPAMDGRCSVCLLLNNGKIVIWRSAAADRAGLAAELARLYPHDGLHWVERLAGKELPPAL